MTDTTSAPTQTTESVEEFAARARAWLAENMPRIDPDNPPERRPRRRGAVAAGPRTPEEAVRRRIRRHLLPPRVRRPRPAHRVPEGVRRRVPRLRDADHPEHADVHDLRRDDPRHRQSKSRSANTFRPRCAATRCWCSCCREPSGGSDLAGVITRADRDGDKWVINGAKTWSTSAFAADYGLMLARTDWDVPKHEGLTMFLVPHQQPGHHHAPHQAGQRLGRVLRGVLRRPRTRRRRRRRRGQRRLGRGVPAAYHERRAVGGGSEFASGIGAEGKTDDAHRLRRACSRRPGQADNERAREMAGRALVHRAVRGAADRPRLPRRPRRLAAPGGGLDHPASRTPRPTIWSSTPRWRSPAAPAWSTTATSLIRYRRALPVPADRGARRRHHRDRTQHHRRTRAGLPPRVRRRPRRAVQSGQAQTTSCAETVRTASAAGPRRGRWRGRDLRRPERPAVGCQTVLGNQRRHPVVQHLPVVRREIRSAPVQLAVLRHQLGVRSRQPRHEPAARRATQMQAEHRHAGRARRGDLASSASRCSTESVRSRQHRRDHDVAVQAGIADRGDQARAVPAATACPARRPCAVRDPRPPATPRR